MNVITQDLYIVMLKPVKTSMDHSLLTATDFRNNHGKYFDERYLQIFGR